jgi:hypothetical protein
MGIGLEEIDWDLMIRANIPILFNHVAYLCI